MWLLNYSYDEFVKKTKTFWFAKEREWKWSHEIWYNPNSDAYFVVPKHKMMSPWVVKNFIKLVKSSVEEFAKI